jgi:hypothetical protein
VAETECAIVAVGRFFARVPNRRYYGQVYLAFTRVFKDSRHPGTFQIRRFYKNDTFGAVVDKALRDKLPKLINTDADEWILLLEREQMLLDELTILREIESRRSDFVDVNKTHIWFAETVFYAKDEIVDFKQFEDNELVQSLEFFNGRLISKTEHGVVTIVERI